MERTLQSFSAAFEYRAMRSGAHRAVASLDDEGGIAAELSYAELDAAARRLGAHLQARGLQGERALLLLPTGLEYVVAFLGCLYAGVTAVPLYPPKLSKPDIRLQAIIADCSPAAVLTLRVHTEEVERRQANLRHAFHPDCWIELDQLGTEALPFTPLKSGPDTLAFLQYTSGSTGSPKGVMVTHGNLVDNCRQMANLFQQPSDGVWVSWLPLYHDMGLIGGTLYPLFEGISTYMFPPVNFLQRPQRWLEAITRYRGTISAVPNFALGLAAKRATPEWVQSLDLSAFSHLVCGSEPIQASTVKRFTECFAPAGFQPRSFLAGYGMAEATLMVSGFRTAGTTRYLACDAEALGQSQVRPPREGEPVRTAVSCGAASPETVLRIVDPESFTPLPEGQIGEVWIRNDSVAAGYWGRPDETAAIFGAHLVTGDGPFLRTGDLGFLVDGELYISGRRKDVIILRGANHYPQDLEQTVEGSHPALRLGGAAAFSIPTTDEESFGVCAEIDRTARRSNLAEVAVAIRSALVEEHGVAPSAIILLSPGTLPKTTSGKVRRHACREGYETESLVALYALIQNRHVPEWGAAARGLADAGGE